MSHCKIVDCIRQASTCNYHIAQVGQRALATLNSLPLTGKSQQIDPFDQSWLGGCGRIMGPSRAVVGLRQVKVDILFVCTMKSLSVGSMKKKKGLGEFSKKGSA